MDKIRGFQLSFHKLGYGNGYGNGYGDGDG
jgi:hypothetical protein